MVDSTTDQPMASPPAEQNVFEDHIALIYESAEERLAAVTPLIKVGLEKGELCLYISNEDDDQGLIEALKAHGVDVDKAMAEGGLILTSKREVYFKLGRFDPDWTLRVLQNVADIARSYGFSAMRIMSDMTWTQDRVPGVERWPEYEAKLNSLHPGVSVRLICQYDHKTFSPEALMATLKTHPKVVSKGQVSKSSYYMPTEELLASNYAERELERMMEIMRTNNQLEAALQDSTEVSVARMQRIRELEDALAHLKAQHGVATASLTELTANFQSQSLELSTARTSLLGMEETIARKDEELVSRTQQMERMEAEMARLKSELAAETLALNESVALAERAKADLAARTEEAEQAWSARDQLYREKEHLLGVVQERDESIVELHAETDRLYALVKERKEELDAAGERLAKLDADLSQQKALAEQRRLDLLVQEAVAWGWREAMDRNLAVLAERAEAASRLEEDLRATCRLLHAERIARDNLAFELSEARYTLSQREAELAAERRALGESNEGYQAIFEQAGVGIVRSDLEGHILEANDRFHTMLGYQPRELVGLSYRDITHRDDLGRTTAMYERLLAGEAASTTLMTKFVRRLGTTTWANVVMFPVRDAQGRPRYFMSIVEDRTDQKMAEMALADLDPAEAAKRQEEAVARSQVLAKDLSDSLTVIMGSVSLAKEYVIPEGRMYGKLKQIENASETARDLASQIMASARIKTEAAPPAPAAALVRGKGRILLMDDDQRILESTGDLLRYLGYNVETARDGAEAIGMAREAAQGGKPYDLAILDLEIRSGMGGQEAAQKLAEENPTLWLIASLGLVADQERSEGAVKGFAATVTKPYSADVLSKTVADVMSQPR